MEPAPQPDAAAALLAEFPAPPALLSLSATQLRSRLNSARLRFTAEQARSFLAVLDSKPFSGGAAARLADASPQVDAAGRVWPPHVPSAQFAAWIVYAAQHRERVANSRPERADVAVTRIMATRFAALPPSEKARYEEQAYASVVRCRCCNRAALVQRPGL